MAGPRRRGVPVVAALSARPVPPRPARRFAALGGVFLSGGLGSLVAAQQTKVPFIIAGILATAPGLLLLAPVGIAGLGRLARLAPLAPGWRCATSRGTGPGRAQHWPRSRSPSVLPPPLR